MSFYQDAAISSCNQALQIAEKNGMSDAHQWWVKACTSGAGIKEAASAAFVSFSAARENGADVDTLRALAARFQFLAHMEEAHRLFKFDDEVAEMA